MKKNYSLFTIFFLMSSCSSPIAYRSTYSLALPQFQDAFVGFSLYDLEQEKYLIRYNDTKYFTPGSNIKLFTYYFAKKLLADSIPLFRYKIVNDSLIIWGTGNPLLLAYHNTDTTLLSFLANTEKHIFISFSNVNQETLGYGWAWDDYNFSFSSEISPIPIYQNTVCVIVDSLGKINSIMPSYFLKNFEKEEIRISSKNKVIRDISQNNFKYAFHKQKGTDTLFVPFKTSEELTCLLLEKKVGKSIKKTKYHDLSETKLYYGAFRDFLLKRMLQQSDNFLAEQTIMLLSNTLFDTLDIRRSIHYLIRKGLSFLSNPPLWIDGSGLSRYNLVTPCSMVELLRKIYLMVKTKKLFEEFPTGGKNGTLKKRFISEQPFIYAKTGTLSNNHNLSGYIVGASGKVYIFSFMMNHFRTPMNKIIQKMDNYLVYLKDYL